MKLRCEIEWLTQITVHKKGFFTKKYLFYALLVACYAVLLPWMYSTIGEPYRSTLHRNEELKEKAIDEGIEEPDEKPLPWEYLPNAWAFVAFIVVFSLNCLIHLAARWFIKFEAWCNFNDADSVDEDCWVLVVPDKHRGRTELCKVFYEERLGSLVFKFHRLKYLVEDGEVVPLGYPTDLHIEDYIQDEGLQDQEDMDIQLDTFGPNKFELPKPTFIEVYKEQIMRPIVVFQVFCALLWALDTYIKYTLFSLMSIFGFEAASVFQRHKNLNTLRGMSNKSYKIKVRRKKKWIDVETADLLPGDCISLKYNSEEVNKAIVPCDCLLVEGSAVVNEATLTGESVPQMKESIHPSQKDQQLDIEGKHNINSLFSGTKLVSISNVDGSTPDGGAKCFVLRTGFASSQGKLMRMIEFSKQEVSGDSKETLAALCVLLCFAIAAAYYVLTEGIKKGDRTTYEIVIKCILIITSVVPPSFPMQMALAVNTALMALIKKGIFCTEPHRVPSAGRVTHCLFDKTGTITTDELIPAGIVNNVANNSLRKFHNASKHTMVVIAGCHSLLAVDGETIGDPIETAALRGIKWRWVDKSQTARQGTWNTLEKKLKELMPDYDKMLKDAKTPKEAKEKKKAKIDKLNQKIAEAKKEADRSKLAVTIVQRFHFSSKLQRMSTIARVNGLEKKGYYALVKGSPEMIEKLCVQVPTWYTEKHCELAETGRRVLAFAWRYLGTTEPQKNTSREDVECQLIFSGFSAFECKTRGDSKVVMNALKESSHHCLMLTGDAPLTSVHVGKQTGMIDPEKKPLLLDVVDGRSSWVPMRHVDRKMLPIPFNPEELSVLRRQYELIVTEDALRATDDLWNHLEHIPIFARMSPQGKAEVVDSLKLKKGNGILYIGDGGNDVGALKNADVGIALLSGFGNANVQEIEENPEADVWSLLRGRNKEIGKKAREKVKEDKEKYARKKRELTGNQQEWLQDAIRERQERGENGFMSTMYAMYDVMQRHRTELSKEGKEMQKKHGTGFAAGAAKWASTMESEEDMGADGVPMVRLGDASVSAPFTSRSPSIQCVIDIVRQGRCTLLSALQQQQIMMLECIISAYTLSALSLQGSRSSEIQLMSTGILLMVASLAFAYSTPIEKIDKVQPLKSLFHPAIFVSVLGQALIHLAVMIYGVSMAKEVMGEEKLQEVTKFFRTLDKQLAIEEENGFLEEAEEDPDPYAAMMAMFNTPFMPNLMNSVVFLLRSSQDIAVLLVNYKGRPWMKGFTENHPLCLSLVLMIAGVGCAAWGIFPQVNDMLQLEPFPSDEFRYQIMILVLCSLVGTFVWDRLCLALFAPQIARKYWDNMMSTSVIDLLPLLMTIGKTVGGILLLASGNPLLWLGAFWLYRRYRNSQAAEA